MVFLRIMSEKMFKASTNSAFLKLLLALLLFYFSIPSNVVADTVYWTGTTSQDWNTASNWLTEGGVEKVPESTDIVHFGNNGTAIYTGDFACTGNLTVGYKSADSSKEPGSWVNPGTGNVTFEGNATFNDLKIGYMYGITNSGGNGSITVNGNFAANTIGIGRDGQGSLKVTGSSVDIGTLATKDNCSIWVSNSSDYSSTYFVDKNSILDFSQVTNVNIYVKNFDISAVKANDSSGSFKFRQGATVLLGVNNNIVADSFAMTSSNGASSASEDSDNPFTSAYPTTVTLGTGTNTFTLKTLTGSTSGQTGGLTISGRKANAPEDATKGNTRIGSIMSIPAGGTFVLQGTLDSNNNPTTTDLRVATSINCTTKNTSYGTLDLSEAASSTMTLNNLVIAYRSGNSSSGNWNKGWDSAANGKVILGSNATITAENILMSYKTAVNSANKSTEPAISLFQVGTADSPATGSSITTGYLRMGNDWGFKLDSSGNVTTTPLDNALSHSTINLSGNTSLSVSNYMVARGDAAFYSGTGTIYTQSLWIGYDQNSTSTDNKSIKTNFYASGDNFSIGSGIRKVESTTNGVTTVTTLGDVFYVGAETTISTSTVATDILVSNAYFAPAERSGEATAGVTNLTINVDRIKIGALGLDDSTNMVSVGHLSMATNNTVTASYVLVGENSVSFSGAVSSIELGEGTNVFHTHDIVIGSNKSDGIYTPETGITSASAMTIRGDKTGTFTLDGDPKYSDTSDRTKSNLTIAYDGSTVTTDNNSVGLVDLSNAKSVNMNLNQLYIAVGQVGSNSVIAGSLSLGDNATVTADVFKMAVATGVETTNKNYGRIILGGNSTLTVSGDWTMGTDADNCTTNVDIGDGSDAVNTSAGGTITVAGAAAITGYSTLHMNKGTLNVAGQFDLGTDTGNGHSVVNMVNGSKMIVGGDIDIDGGATITITDSDVHAASIVSTPSADKDKTILTVSGDSHLLAETIKPLGESEVNINGGLVEAINADVTGTITGSSNTTFKISGGHVIADNIDVVVGQGETAFTGNFEFSGGRLSLGSFVENAAASFALKLKQTGTSVLAPGYDSNGNVGKEGMIFKGETRIHGNYVLDSGSIELDITSAIDRDNVYVNKGTATGNTGTANLSSSDNVAIKIISSSSLEQIAEMLSSEDTVLNGSNVNITKYAIPLLYADDFQLNSASADSAAWTEWGRAHVLGLIGDINDWYFEVYDLTTDSTSQQSMEATLDTLAFTMAAASQDGILLAQAGASSDTKYVLRAYKTVIIDVPEPATWLLLLIGCTGLYYLAKRNYTITT